MKICMDTNILIYFLEGIEPEASKAEKILKGFTKNEDEGIVSTITVAEVLTGFYLEGDLTRVNKMKNIFDDLTFSSLKIVPVTFRIADMAANLRAKRGGKLPDAIIVATALDQAANVVYSEDKDLLRFSKDVRICGLL